MRRGLRALQDAGGLRLSLQSGSPEFPKAAVSDLATCIFVQRKQNALLLGPTGVGKSHIAQALGHRACRAGHSVLYVAASDLFKQLRAARGDHTYDKCLHRFTIASLLIVDDLGLTPLSGDEPLDLYEIIRFRYQRGATVLQSSVALGPQLRAA